MTLDLTSGWTCAIGCYSFGFYLGLMSGVVFSRCCYEKLVVAHRYPNRKRQLL